VISWSLILFQSLAERYSESDTNNLIATLFFINLFFFLISNALIFTWLIYIMFVWIIISFVTYCGIFYASGILQRYITYFVIKRRFNILDVNPTKQKNGVIHANDSHFNVAEAFGTLHFNSRFDTFYCWLQLVWSR